MEEENSHIKKKNTYKASNLFGYLLSDKDRNESTKIFDEIQKNLQDFEFQIYEPMRLIKFENTVEGLWKKFKKFKIENTGISSLKSLLGENSDNKYAQIILDKSFNKKVATSICSYTCQHYTMIGLIDGCRYCNKCSRVILCNLPNQLIFFALMFVAIDNKAYNEKLNIISDLACLVDFNMEMIDDWIYVVKAVLNEELIDFRRFNTRKAELFFKVLK